AGGGDDVPSRSRRGSLGSGRHTAGEPEPHGGGGRLERRLRGRRGVLERLQAPGGVRPDEVPRAARRSLIRFGRVPSKAVAGRAGDHELGPRRSPGSIRVGAYACSASRLTMRVPNAFWLGWTREAGEPLRSREVPRRLDGGSGDAPQTMWVDWIRHIWCGSAWLNRESLTFGPSGSTPAGMHGGS